MGESGLSGMSVEVGYRKASNQRMQLLLKKRRTRLGEDAVFDVSQTVILDAG